MKQLSADETQKLYGYRLGSVQQIKEDERTRIKNDLFYNELNCSPTPVKEPITPLVRFPVDESVVKRLTDLIYIKEHSIRLELNRKKRAKERAERKRAITVAFEKFRHLIKENQKEK